MQALRLIQFIATSTSRSSVTQEIKAAVHRLNGAPTAKESHCSGSAHTGISKTPCSSLQGEIGAKIAQCEMLFIQDEREHTGHP